uniref:Uncharacterized protein n=1 Tax=viral metagenome TaxID=1070528 RepID=A0A6C0L0T8_9ZZZZ|tara:strand:- start:5820 stop:6851 length:1032 start_codon:yes stop_codon:yes gene_type:complete
MAVVHEVKINDIREKYKTTSFSNFKKTELCKKLQNSIYYNKREEAFFWTCEMLCSNMLLEIWDTYLILMSKYIHIYNPKLPLYLNKKYSEFRDIVGADDSLRNIQNNQNLRLIFCSITTVLSCSEKLTILDHLQHKFVFKIESLYENLKAPNTTFVDLVYKQDDPVEYLIPFNEFIYHLTETKQKVAIIYWLNWIIEYDILCRKKKKNIGCVARDIYQNQKKNLETNIIWIIWDAIFIVMKDGKISHNVVNIVNSIYNLFMIRYCVSINKKRMCLICHAIELVLLHKEVKYNIPILNKSDELKNMEENIYIVMEQIKKNEIKTLPDVGPTKKMDMYQNIYMNL